MPKFEGTFGMHEILWSADEVAGGASSAETIAAAEAEVERVERLQEEIVERLRELKLEETGPVLRELATGIERYRDTNKGFVPRAIFKETLQVGGKDSCAEVVVRQVDKNGNVLGYWLKQRGSAELGWEGQFQVVGCSLTDNEGDEESIKTRLAKEVFGVADPTRLEGARRLGQTLHSEAKDGRARACRTEVLSIDVSGSYALSDSGEGWQFFTIDSLDQRVVDHHHNTLAWANDENRVATVDLREVYKPTQHYKVKFRVYAGSHNEGTEKRMTVRAQNEREAALKASTLANLPEYRKGAGRDDFWLFEVDTVVPVDQKAE